MRSMYQISTSEDLPVRRNSDKCGNKGVDYIEFALTNNVSEAEHV